jgi:glycosyltransferase involved in cell wall biosynthesis
MQVLMTADTIGGVWTFAIELCQEFSRRDMQIVLATLGRLPNESQLEEARSIPGLRLEPSDFKLEWMENPWYDLFESSRWLLSLEKQYAPSLVHLNSYGHGMLPWQAPVVLTAHSCVASWWAAVKHAPLPPEWQRYRRLVADSLKSVQRITTTTRAMRDMLLRDYDLDPADHPVDVISNGRTAAAFFSGEKLPFILTAGRLWDEGKNVSAMERIAASLPWPVYLAGETSGNTTGARALDRLSPRELAQYYAQASIYALPARYEPFGYTALEAALSGCALVLGDIPSLREVWGDAACFVPPDDHNALAEALRVLIENPSRRAELARSGLARAREFTPERMAVQYLEAYTLASKEGAACAS